MFFQSSAVPFDLPKLFFAGVCPVLQESSLSRGIQCITLRNEDKWGRYVYSEVLLASGSIVVSTVLKDPTSTITSYYVKNYEVRSGIESQEYW